MNNYHFGQGILSLEKTSNDAFIGTPYDLGWKRLYGGHLIAQSLYAAHQSSQREGILHSFHSYFLHVGNCRHDLQYNVSSLRAGRQSSVIQVQTHQNNRFLFQVMASFTKGNPQLHHTPSMPNVPSPMDLNDDHEMLCDLLKTFPHSRGLRNFVSRRTNSDTCLDIKPIEPQNFLHSSENTSARRLWFRMRTSLPEELSTILLSYTSDFLLVGISLQPHNLSILHPTLKFVSLDHSMWFYDSFPRNSWILLEANSEVYAHGRCLVQGNFFREDGTLIARCSQEGLIHIRQRGAQ